MSRIYDIASKSGVSTATVSRVFNKKPFVRDEVKKKVLKVARELNYSPKLTARKDNVAIIVEGIDEINIGNYGSSLITTISRLLIENGLNFLIVPVSEIDFVHQNFVMGAIAIVHAGESIKRIREVKEFPVLMINCPVKNLHSICSDHKQGIQLAVNYLFKFGHERIGILLASGSSWGEEERLEGYKESMKKSNIKFDGRLIQTGEKQSTFEAAAKILKAKSTSLIISGEDCVLPVTYALNLLNQRIPDDISVISFENERVSKYLTPPHTTISQHIKEIAETSVKEMVKIIRDKRKGLVNIKIKNSLNERESVKDRKVGIGT